jgi:hypothetical protein
MKCYTYIVARDFGFAPNPFNQYCTLATCKPRIRSVAQVGDWVVGMGSVKNNQTDEVTFAMKVTEALSFNEYWNDERFKTKKPVMNGSLMQAYGDNIYHYDEKKKEWHQEDSHHSNEDGSVNKVNLDKDTQTDRVLISDHFYYFGKSSYKLPENLRDKVCQGIGHKNIESENDIITLLKWVKSVGELNVLKGFPSNFDPKEFKVYKGKE